MSVVTACKAATIAKLLAPRASAHALALYALCAQPMGRLHLAQPVHSGRSDGDFDGAFAEEFEVARLSTL